MTELKHLQAVILSIAKDIDKLCRDNGIEYYLLGGSCIGAIRHKDFIPWDDDLDIVMTHDNYDRFLEVCREKLDTSKYLLQEGRKDWPLNYSKMRLKGTYLHEPEDEYASADMHGIFVDIFRLDNVPDSDFLARLQYVLAKYDLSYQLGKRGYVNASLKKKLMMILASPMRIAPLRKAVERFIESFNSRPTRRVGLHYGRTVYRTTITPREVFGTPKYVQFADTKFPVPEKYHEYLTQMFGDYMQLPPEDQRRGQHMLSVDFGKY